MISKIMQASTDKPLDPAVFLRLCVIMASPGLTAATVKNCSMDAEEVYKYVKAWYELYSATTGADQPKTATKKKKKQAPKTSQMQPKQLKVADLLSIGESITKGKEHGKAVFNGKWLKAGV